MEGEQLHLIPGFIQDYVDHAVNMARQIAQSADPVASVVIVGNPEGIMVFPFELENDEHHAIKATIIRHYAKQMDATHVLMISEAWLVRDDKEEHPGPIRDDPRARDVILFQLETHFGIWFADADIPPHDFKAPKPRDFGTPVFEFGSITNCAFNSLLPKYKGTMQ